MISTTVERDEETMEVPPRLKKGGGIQSHNIQNILDCPMRLPGIIYLFEAGLLNLW